MDVLQVTSMTSTKEPTRKQRKVSKKQQLEDQDKIDKELKRKYKSENKQFAGIMYCFVFLFLAMMGYLVYFQIVLSPTIINSPYNPRQNILASQVIRGNIKDGQGNILAKTEVASDGTESRVYPMGEMYAHVVGYDIMGKSGIELSNNFNLLTSNSFFLEKIKNELKKEKNQGDTIVTTLNSNVQKAAYNALGKYNGAVMVVEVNTGKILASVSKGSFDPTFQSKSWDIVSNSDDALLLNRATQGIYVPGSIFKVVTLLDYMRMNPNYHDYSYECKGYIEYGDTKIQCSNKSVHGKQDLEEAFANSCNGAFIDIGMKLNVNSFQATANSLLFNQDLPGTFSVKNSTFSLTESTDTAKVMMTSMGQGDTGVSVYHMLTLISAIANDGMLMEPYLIDRIENDTGSTVKVNNPVQYGTLMSVSEATQIQMYMKEVVNSGTATNLKSQKYTAAGKTGTAEYSSDKNDTHSWFIGYANTENPEIAISVVVEGSNGGLKATTVAKEVFNAYY